MASGWVGAGGQIAEKQQINHRLTEQITELGRDSLSQLAKGHFAVWELLEARLVRVEMILSPGGSDQERMGIFSGGLETRLGRRLVAVWVVRLEHGSLQSLGRMELRGE